MGQLLPAAIARGIGRNAPEAATRTGFSCGTGGDDQAIPHKVAASSLSPNRNFRLRDQPPLLRFGITYIRASFSLRQFKIVKISVAAPFDMPH